MQAKRKQPDVAETGEAENDSHASTGSGLLKKRLSRSKVDKTHKTVQR